MLERVIDVDAHVWVKVEESHNQVEEERIRLARRGDNLLERLEPLDKLAARF